MSRVYAAVTSLLFLAACGFPGTVEARAFTTGFKAGETIRYRLHESLTGTLLLGAQQLPLNVDQTLTQVLRVRSVDKSGSATVEVSIEDAIGNAAGSTTTIKPPPVELQIGPDGRIRSASGAQIGGPIPSIPGSDQLTPILPGHPVKPGDCWDKDYSRPNPYGSGQIGFTTHSCYVKDEAAAGLKAAVVDTTLRSPIDFSVDFSQLPAAVKRPTPALVGLVHYSGSIDSSQRYWLQLPDHQLLRSTGSGKYRLSYSLSVAAGQASGPQQIDVNGEIKTALNRI